MKDDRGITLIELVVTIGMLAGILLVIYAFYSMGIRSFGREYTTADNQFRVRRNSNAIAREIRRSDRAENEGGRLALFYSNDEKKLYYQVGSVIKQGEYNKSPSGGYDMISTFDLVDGIKSFSFDIVDSKVIVTIESVENSEGDTYKLENEIIIRR